MSSLNPIRYDHTDVGAEPVADLFGRIAEELLRMAQSIERVSLPLDVMGERAADLRDPTFFDALQGLDLTSQKLNCLSDFLSELARCVPRHWSLDLRAATELVTLSQLARRLSPSSDQGEGSEAAEGDFEMF